MAAGCAAVRMTPWRKQKPVRAFVDGLLRFRGRFAAPYRVCHLAGAVCAAIVQAHIQGAEPKEQTLKQILVIAAAGLLLAASPALAQPSMEALYKDALEQDGYGTTLFDRAQLEFMNGDAYEACTTMEQARQFFMKAEDDMKAMDDMVHDEANGYSAEDQEKTMTWIHQQQETLNGLAAIMARHYDETCRDR